MYVFFFGLGWLEIVKTIEQVGAVTLDMVYVQGHLWGNVKLLSQDIWVGWCHKIATCSVNCGFLLTYFSGRLFLIMQLTLNFRMIWFI